jgi:hypothetical protein
VELCSQTYLPCALFIQGDGPSSTDHKVYRRGTGVISCKSESDCTGLEMRGFILECNQDIEAAAGPLQASGVELAMVDGIISHCRSAQWGGVISASNGAQVSISHSQISQCSSQVTFLYNVVPCVMPWSLSSPSFFPAEFQQKMTGWRGRRNVWARVSGQIDCSFHKKLPVVTTELYHEQDQREDTPFDPAWM